MKVNKEHIQGLNLLRALAILLVVFLHTTHITKNLPNFIYQMFSIGWIGVDMFFVLSGFLIGKQVFDEPENNSPFLSLKIFWAKRWIRTLPLYFAVLFFYAVIKPSIGYPFQDGHWGFIIFLQNYLSLNDFAQSWSLCIEEQFYIIFPILAFIFNLRNKHFMIWSILIAVSIFSRLIVYQSGVLVDLHPATIDFNLRFLTHTHLDGIAMGILLAATFDYWSNFKVNLRRIIGLAGFILAFGTPIISGYSLPGLFSVFTFTLISLGFSLLLIWSYHLKINRKLYFPFERIALYSYGIYIWNHVITRSFVNLKWDYDWYFQAPLFIFFSILVPIITYYLIEMPFMNLRAKVLQKLSIKKLQ